MAPCIAHRAGLAFRAWVRAFAAARGGRRAERKQWFEVFTSALQIAIVLASVSVVTGMGVVGGIGAALGFAAGLSALLVMTAVI